MGLQTVDRAVAVLHLLGGQGPDGVRLVDVQGRLKLSKPTAHRLLTSLVSHGFVEQDETTRRYRLGGRLAVLAWSVPGRLPDLRSIAALSVHRLAYETGDTVVLTVLDGLESVCVARESGSFQIRVQSLDVGTRRPLGVGAGGFAVLAAMSPDDAQRVLASVEPRLADFPHTSLQLIRRRVEHARRAGYAVSDGTVAEGVHAVAVAIRDAQGRPIGSIGVAAIRSRMGQDRIKVLVPRLLEERAEIERQVAA